MTASSSSLRPQDVIGKAKSQSPLRGEDAARKKADGDSAPRLDLTIAIIIILKPTSTKPQAGKLG